MKIDLDYIKVKLKVNYINLQKFLTSFFMDSVVIGLIALGLMLSFDFILGTGHGLRQFIECIALYFITMEIKPYILKTVIFK